MLGTVIGVLHNEPINNQKTRVMKRLILVSLTVLGGMLFIYAFRGKDPTSITGRINPIGGAHTARAVSGRDSSTSTIVNGEFYFAAKPGLYKVVIDAVEPYKDVILENIEVKEGQTVNVGEIILQK
jgi:hypothetical protein